MAWVISISASVLLDSVFIISTRDMLTEGREGLWDTLRVFISLCIGFVISLPLFYIFGLSETGDLPWVLAFKNPVWAVPILCSFLYRLTMMAALWFIYAGVYGAVSEFDTVIIFIGLIFINIFTGRFDDAKSFLSPVELISLIGLLAAVYILNREQTSEPEEVPKLKKGKFKFAIGLTIGFISTFFDAADSLSMDYLLTGEEADTYDYMIAYIFWHAVAGIICWTIMSVKRKKTYNPFGKSNRFLLVIGFLEVASDLTDVLATSLNAVYSEIVWGVSPVVPILLAIIFLKEKYTIKQVVCFAAIIVFGLVLVVAEMAA